MSRTIVLAAGGTGGHVFPARALADALAARGHRPVFLTDERAQAYGDAFGGHPVGIVRSGTPTGRGLAGKAGAALRIAGGWFDARRRLRELRPDAVVGFGGYPALPTMLAALALGRPTAIHEQNAVLGKVNRLLAGRVDVIAASHPDTRMVQPADRGKVVVTGNPVRAAVAALAAHAYVAPTADGPFCLLAFGGSQGARTLAEVVPAALLALPAALQARMAVTLQTRPEDRDAAEAPLAGRFARLEVAPFFTDMAERLDAAHLVVARAGAGTVAELAAAGRPAVLAPYMFATDDHQTANAAALVEAGGAWLADRAAFNPAWLAGLIAELAAAPGRLAAAAAAARGVGHPGAAERLAHLVERLAAGQRAAAGPSAHTRRFAA